MDVKEGAHEAPTKVYKGALSTEERSHLIPELAQSGRVLQHKFIEAQKYSTASSKGVDIKSLPSWAADSTQAGIPSLDRGIKSRITSYCRREVVVLVRKHLLEEKGLAKFDPTPLQHITSRKVSATVVREANPFFIESREFDKLFVNLLPNNVVLPALMHQLEEHILAHRVGVQEKVGIHVEENGNKVQLFHHAPTLAEVRGLNIPPSLPEHHYFISFRYTEQLVRFAAACAMPLEMTDSAVEQQDYEKFLRELELSVSVEGVPPTDVHDFINVGLHADTHPYADSADKIKREGRKRRLQIAQAKMAAEREAQLAAEKEGGGEKKGVDAEVSDHVDVCDPCDVSPDTPPTKAAESPVEVLDITPPTTPRVNKKKRGGRKRKQPKVESPPKSPTTPAEPFSELPPVDLNSDAVQKPAPECEQADLSDPQPAPKPPQRVGKKSKRRMFGDPPPYEAVGVWPPYRPMWTPEALQRVMGSVVLPKGTDLNMAPRGLLDYFHHPAQAVSPFRPASATSQALLTHSHTHHSDDDDDISIDDLLPKLEDDEDCEGVSSQPPVSTSDTPRITHDPDHRTIVDSLSEDVSTSSMNSSSSSFSSVVGSQRGVGGGSSGGGSMWSSGTTSPFHQALDWRAPASPMAPLPPSTGSKKVGRRSARRKGPRVPSIPKPMRPADIELPTSPPLYIPLSPPMPSTPTMALSLYRGVAPQPGRRRQLTVREALMRVLASGSGSANRRVQNRLAITGPSAANDVDTVCSDDESPRRQRLRASPQWQQRRRIRKALQRAGRTNWCTVNNPQTRPKFQTVWRHTMGRRVVKRRRTTNTGTPSSNTPPPSSLVPTGVSADVSVSEGDILHARALLRKATFWGRDNVDTVSEALGVDGTTSDTIQFHWNLPLPDTQSADSLPPSDPQHPTSQVRSLSTVLHTALQHSYFMEGSTLAMTMSSETVPTACRKHPSPPDGHPHGTQQPFTTRSMISVAVTADKSRLPVVSIPTAFLDRLHGGASSSSSGSPRDDQSHLNVLVALEPNSDEDGSPTNSVSHYTLPTNEQVISALHSMVEGGFGNTPSSSSTSSPTNDKAKKGSSRGTKGTNNKGGWSRKRLSISELPASSLTGASNSRNNAIYFANSPIFRALEGFLNAAISQLPYVAVYPHRDGVITSAEPQLISTEEQPLLLLFLLLSGRGSEHGGLALPSSTFGQRLLM